LNFNYNKNTIKQEPDKTIKKNKKSNDDNSLKTLNTSTKFMKNYMIEDIDKCLDICESTFVNDEKIKLDPIKKNDEIESLYNKKIKQDSPTSNISYNGLNEFNLKALNSNNFEKKLKGKC